MTTGYCTLKDGLAWGSFEGLGPDIVEGIRRIKSQDGPDLILSGSSTLTSPLLEQCVQLTVGGPRVF